MRGPRTHLEEESVFLDPRHIKVVRDGTHSNDQPVIRYVVDPAGVQDTHTLHPLGLCVQSNRVGEVEVVLVTEAGVPHGLDDAAELQCAHGGAGQERREEEVVARADDNHVVPVTQVLLPLHVT